MKLEEEGGITDISLKNAEKLIAKYGKPGQLFFTGDRKKCDYYVTVFWDVQGRIVKFIFSGFAWGYKGTGPHGFFRFLQMCGQDEAQAKQTIDILEGRMEADRWNCTSSSLSLNDDFLKKWGYL